MFKRDTRVQIVILENGRYILLKHLHKPTNYTFWGFPGGGREEHESDEEAAIREAWEETNLHVKLLPFKLELEPLVIKVYRRIVTFLAIPIGGVASKGYEPEAEIMTNYEYELLDIKWQDLYDEEMDEITRQSILPIRDFVVNNTLKKRVSAIIYKMEGDQLLFLLEKENCQYMIPTLTIEHGLVSLQAIETEFQRKKNMNIKVERKLGFYFSELNGSFNQIFLYLFSTKQSQENMEGVWLSIEELKDYKLQRQIYQYIEEIVKEIANKSDKSML